MEKKFNIVVGEDGTVKLPDAVLEKLEVKPGEEVRFEVDDNFYAVRLLSRIEAERLDYLNWMHPPFLQIYQNTACITCESYCVPRAAFRSTPERTLYVFSTLP